MSQGLAVNTKGLDGKPLCGEAFKAEMEEVRKKAVAMFNSLDKSGCPRL